MNNKKKNLFYKIPLRTPPTRRASQRLGFNGGGNKIEWQFFFCPAAETIRECGTSTDGWREGERERKGGWVSCERIHTVEFCILSLAACGLKQHPPTHRNSHYAKECTREREDEGWRERRRWTGGEGTCEWPLVIFIGRVYRRALGTKKKGKKSEGRETSGSVKRGGNERERENGERRVSQSGDFFSALIYTGGWAPEKWAKFAPSDTSRFTQAAWKLRFECWNSYRLR